MTNGRGLIAILTAKNSQSVSELKLELKAIGLLSNIWCTSNATPPDRRTVTFTLSYRYTVYFGGKYTLLECAVSSQVFVMHRILYTDSSTLVESIRLFAMLPALL